MAVLNGFSSIVDGPPEFGEDAARRIAEDAVRLGEMHPDAFLAMFGEPVAPEIEEAWPSVHAALLFDTARYMESEGLSEADFRRIFGEAPPAGTLQPAPLR